MGAVGLMVIYVVGALLILTVSALFQTQEVVLEIGKISPWLSDNVEAISVMIQIVLALVVIATPLLMILNAKSTPISPLEKVGHKFTWSCALCLPICVVMLLVW